MNNTSQAKVISILAALMLFLTYIACGFTVCATLPITTEKLSSMTSNFEDSPYSEQDLTELALEVRDFTVNDYGRSDMGEAGAENALAATILEHARSSAEPASPTHDRWSAEALEVLEADDPSFDVTIQNLYEAGPEYSLDEDAISHLNDVNDVLSRLFIPMLAIAVLAAFCLMASLRYYGYSIAAKSLLYAGIATIAVLAILGIWALLSFDSLFAALHSIFFAAGTWTFPADSLLIEMYPIDFWIGMAAVWFISSCVIAVLSIIFGLLIKKAHERSIERMAKRDDEDHAEGRTACGSDTDTTMHQTCID